MGGEQVVLLDTNAYGALYVTPEETARKQGFPLDEWRVALQGHRVVIAFQTRAEVLVGARSAKWGESRMKALNERLNATPTVQLDEDVFEAYVTLTVDARARGNGIGQRLHTADRWIAACAIAKSVPLLSRDGIFADAPALSLFEVGDV
ncbi:MAG: PIN domain-containing protein [Micropruina sp.]|nr:PIN domain-containing protein [Micropruina sp.]